MTFTTDTSQARTLVQGPQTARTADAMGASTVTWHYEGHTDGLVGTGATNAERLMGYGTALLLTTIIVGADMMRGSSLAATWWQIGILAFFAYDIAGGAVANMLNSCKRLYHSSRKPTEGPLLAALKDARVFTGIHVHPIIIAATLGGSLSNSVIWYLALQVAVWLTLAAPLYLRRAAATALVMVAILVHQIWLPLGTGLEWVIPALFIKMVLGHAVQEEPYAAATQMVVAQVAR
ncbi:hypothetical protein ABWH92_03280 [Ahrensia marina]|uniref:hypothetical protein n=1 Tax=Ahrensia marina TaxID=1514904 RepID=UPI0035CF79BD